MTRRVLIVEDEVLVGMMLSKQIGAYGFAVVEIVTTGEAVLEAVKRHQPGVVLMDISLGGEVDGIEAARQLSEEAPVPVVFFTGYHRDAKLMARAREVGALAVLDKLGPVEEMAVALEKATSSNGD